MKGIGAAGGGGPPRPPQPPYRPRRRHIPWGPCAVQTLNPFSPGIPRASAPRGRGRRSSAPDLGAARLPPGAAPHRPQLPGCGGQRAPRVRWWGIPPGSRRCSLCWQRGLCLWGCRLPGLALGKCRGAGASAALAAPGECSCTKQRVCLRLPVCLPLKRSTALASGLWGGIVKYSCLSKSSKQRETPLWCLRCSPFQWVPARRKGTDEDGAETCLILLFFGVRI